MVFSNRAKSFALFAILLFASAGYAAPVAAAGADQVANVGQNVTVSGASSTCSGCTIVSYSWNWGDGNTSSGVSATHAYGAADGYTATLTVVANDSSVSSDTLSVTVQGSDSQSPTITHTNVTNWTQNQSIPISATVTDNVGVSTATLYYKNASAASYSSTTMSASGSTYSGTIPNTSTSESNALYYITATDTASPANTQSHGSSSSPVNISLSATDTIAPITTLTSVTGDTSSPYWVTLSNSTNNTVVLLSGESGMSCRMGQSNSNYTGMTVGYVDCTISGSTANCTTQLADSNYTRFVACKDSTGNEQNTSQTLNISFGVDSVAPTAISPVNATEGTTKISLSWTAPTDATSGVSVQKIFRSTGSSCANYSSIQSAYSATGTSYNDTSVSAGTTYCYYVVGQDTAGNVQSSYTATTAINYGAPLITAISLTLSGSTLTLAATTNENASCRYSASNLSYANMASNFTTTGATSHSATGSGSSGTITYYVSCADTAGNNMTTANSTSYTFSSGSTTTSTGGSNSGGGSVAGGGSPSSSASPAETFTITPASGEPATVSVSRSVSFDSTENKSTFTLKIENPGASATGAITVKEKIPERVANSTDELEFSPPPTRFESGSIIAAWDLAGGIGPGESLAFTYSVKKPVASLAGFEATVISLVPPAPLTPPAQLPEQPPAKQPEQQPPKKPAPAAPAAPAPAALPPETPQPGILGSLAGVIGMLLAIAVVGGAVFFFMKLRKKKEP